MARSSTDSVRSDGSLSLASVVSWILAIAAGSLHTWEIAGYHSALNSLAVKEQQVAALKTENAFYYSYYQQVVTAPSLADGWLAAYYDDRSEAPDTINAIGRFNIYQELVFASLWRLIRQIMSTLGWAAYTPDPWYFFRGALYVLSGCGQVALVRLAVACGDSGWCGGVLPSLLLMLLLFLHRPEVGRVGDIGLMNLREQFAIPCLWMQVLSLYLFISEHPLWQLDNDKVTNTSHACARKVRHCGCLYPRRLAFWGSTLACLLLWQFSAFAFLLQVSALFLCTLLACDERARGVLRDVVSSHLGVMVAATILFFGNELYLHHLLITQCLAILIALRRIRGGPYKFRWFWLDGLVAVVIFLAIRAAQSRWATADEHLSELFWAKVGDLAPGLGIQQAAKKTFNARLYLAVSVFNFISLKTIQSFVPTGVLHLGGLGAVLTLAGFLRNVVLPCAGEIAPLVNNVSTEEKKQSAAGAIQAVSSEEAAYSRAFARGVLLFQLVLWLALGCFIARLKVLGASLLCLLAATSLTPGVVGAALALNNENQKQSQQPTEQESIASSDDAGDAAGDEDNGKAPSGASGFSKFGRGFGLVALAMGQLCWLLHLWKHMPFLGTAEDWAIQGDMHWSDADSCELYDWMALRIPANATVMTSMSFSGQMRLFTPYKMVIHPQFESRSLRDRVQEIYEFYQCTPPEKFLRTMVKFKAEYIVLEYKRCDFSPFVLDHHPELNCDRGDKPWKDLFCPRAHTSEEFELIFANSAFALFRANLGTSKKVDTKPREPYQIESPKTWKPMLDKCISEEPLATCAGRIAELSAVFHEKLKKPMVGQTLHKLLAQKAPHDGIAQYWFARHNDYELKNVEAATHHYRRAYELLPNNPEIVRELLMWYEIEVKSTRWAEWLTRTRRHTLGGKLSVLELGEGHLACEASVTALNTLRDADWAKELWALANAKSGASACIKANWEFHHGKTIEDDLGKWGIFWNVFWHHKRKSHLQVSAGPGVRFAPQKNVTRTWAFGLGGMFGMGPEGFVGEL